MLPPPDDGDVYFDMEGDPLWGDDGLEYLFGVYYRSTERCLQIQRLLGTLSAEEKAAFEQFMDWLDQRIRKHPCLHVYHYASYEDTALKKLSGRHSTREALLDQLLRERRLVDLYQVVREAIRASTPSYSIKDIEKFYRGARQGDVQTAGASIVYYERYLETGDKALLEKIERYNEDDVGSTQQLHEWLLEPAPQRTCGGAAADERWRHGTSPAAFGQAAGLPRPGGSRAQCVVRLDRTGPRVMADLLEFHRRQEKPQWWEMFARAELAFDDLVESVDGIAGLKRVPGTQVDEYEYPAQEIKFDAGD